MPPLSCRGAIMANLENTLLALLVLDALALTVLVLIQQGKGADVGAAFGGGSANTMFGSSGAGSFLTRLTTGLSIAFFCISFGLAYTAKERAESLGDLGLPQVEEAAAGLPEIELIEGTPESIGLPDVSDDGAGAALEDAGAELTDEQDSVDSALTELPDV